MRVNRREIGTRFWASYFDDTLIDTSRVRDMNRDNSTRLTFGRAMVEGLQGEVAQLGPHCTATLVQGAVAASCTESGLPAEPILGRVHFSINGL